MSKRICWLPVLLPIVIDDDVPPSFDATTEGAEVDERSAVIPLKGPAKCGEPKLVERKRRVR